MSASVGSVLPGELVRGITRLEPLPVTAQRLISMMNGEDVSLVKLAELIEFDQAIAAAVLKATRSARFAGYAAPTNVRDAVVRLGTVTLLDLVLEGYLKSLRGTAPLYELGEHDLWLHGAASQLAVRALIVECPEARIPAVAEPAALLHDIGKLVMARYLKADVRQLLAHARGRNITFTEAERELLGVDHALVGAAVAEHWAFPAEITYAILHHHDVVPAQPSVVLDAVVMANLVAKTIETGLGAEGLNFAIDPGVHKRLGMSFDMFGRTCLQTLQWLRELADTHGVAL